MKWQSWTKTNRTAKLKKTCKLWLGIQFTSTDLVPSVLKPFVIDACPESQCYQVTHMEEEGGSGGRREETLPKIANSCTLKYSYRGRSHILCCPWLWTLRV